MPCAASSKDEQQKARRVPKRVEGEEQLRKWEREVQTDPDLKDDQRLQYFLWLLSSPDVLDRETWRIKWSPTELAKVIGPSRTTIDSREDDLQESKYVHRAGTAPIQTGRGEDTVRTYALVLPTNV